MCLVVDRNDTKCHLNQQTISDLESGLEIQTKYARKLALPQKIDGLSLGSHKTCWPDRIHR